MTTQRTGKRPHSAYREKPKRPADRRRVPRAILICVGLLATAPVAFPHAQVDRIGRKVTGVVVAAATQQPVPNARVGYEETGQPPQTTVTDAKGAFELPAGRVGVVTVTARNFGTARRRWPPHRGSRLRIELVPPAIVTGTVTDLATGRLLPAVVTVRVRHADNFVSHTARARRGTFRIDDLPPGPGLVTTRSTGFAPSIGSITVEGGKERDTRIGLLLEAQATGQVVDRAGAPVAGAFVKAKYVRLAGGRILRSFVGGNPFTGSDGTPVLATTHRQPTLITTPVTGTPKYRDRTAGPSMVARPIRDRRAVRAGAEGLSPPLVATIWNSGRWIKRAATTVSET